MSGQLNGQANETGYRRIAAGFFEPRSFTVRIFARHRFTLLLLIVVGVEVVVGLMAIRDLRSADVATQRTYAGSLQSWRRIGELQYAVQETGRSTLYALTAKDDNLQVSYAGQSREADHRVAKGIAEYLAQAQMPQEIELGKSLANDWNAYLKNRDDVLGFILADNPNAAAAVDLTLGVALFERVRHDLEEIKRLYDEQASQQLRVVAGVARPLVLKIIGTLGFALLFGNLAIWAIQRSKMRDAFERVKLQTHLVASVSHELRTPITAILSAGENVRDGLVHRRKDLVEQGSIIVDQASQLGDLVDQVLRFTATTNSKPAWALRPLGVSQILECALRNTAGLLQKSGFTVEQQIQQGLPPVMGDLSAISQCLQNLIANAVKYSHRDRWIRLSVRIDESATHKLIGISVQDHGIGISTVELPRIFETFYRSPRVVAAQIHGTGLGLSIAKRNAEQLGGRLSVTSELDVGSTFTLHLPVAEEDRKLVPVRSAPDFRMAA